MRQLVVGGSQVDGSQRAQGNSTLKKKANRKRRTTPSTYFMGTPSSERLVAQEQASQAEFVEQEPWLTFKDKVLAGTAMTTGVLACIFFAWTKWDIEAKLQAMPAAEEKAWRDGTYKSRRPPGTHQSNTAADEEKKVDAA